MIFLGPCHGMDGIGGNTNEFVHIRHRYERNMEERECKWQWHLGIFGRGYSRGSSAARESIQVQQLYYLRHSRWTFYCPLLIQTVCKFQWNVWGHVLTETYLASLQQWEDNCEKYCVEAGHVDVQRGCQLHENLLGIDSNLCLVRSENFVGLRQVWSLDSPDQDQSSPRWPESILAIHTHKTFYFCLERAYLPQRQYFPSPNTSDCQTQQEDEESLGQISAQDY